MNWHHQAEIGGKRRMPLTGLRGPKLSMKNEDRFTLAGLTQGDGHSGDLDNPFSECNHALFSVVAPALCAILLVAAES